MHADPYVPPADLSRQTDLINKPPTVYVVGFMLNVSSGCVLLVRKKTPLWQQGRLNGVGGKVEAFDADDLAAMRREWREETGFAFDDWRKFARQRGNGYDVRFFCARGRLVRAKDRNDVGEILEWWRLREIVLREDLITNLKWLLPMAFNDDGAPAADVVDSVSPLRHAAAPCEAAERERAFELQQAERLRGRIALTLRVSKCTGLDGTYVHAPTDAVMAAVMAAIGASCAE